MSSWEDIANEVAPTGVRPKGLVTGAARRALMDAEQENEERGSSAAARLPAPLDPRFVSPPCCAPDAALDSILCGSECESEAGKFYRITRAAKEFDPAFDDLETLLGEGMEYLIRKTRQKCELKDVLFMDIETTGLSSSTPLFLIGTLRQEDSRGLLELFLARGFEEERAALTAFHRIAEDKALVTFNGKSFDWPYIEGRSLRCNVKNSRPRAHFDLLHHARREWKPLLPNCRLQTLEYYLCGRKRDGDIPSSRIPEQYLEFVDRYSATGRGAHLLAPIVHHNAWDVLTMAELLRRFDPSHSPKVP